MAEILKQSSFPDSPEMFLAKLEKAMESFGKREGCYIKWLKENYDDSSYLPWEEDLSNGYPTLNRSLIDLDHGVVLIAGESNRGKSTTIANIVTSSLTLNEDVIVLDLTFDDNSYDRVRQYLCSMTGLTYQQIKLKAGMSEGQQKMFQIAYGVLKDWVKAGRLRFYDSVEQLDSGGILKMRYFSNLIEAIRTARQKAPNAKIVVIVDSWHNLETSDGKGANEYAQSNFWIERIHEELNLHQAILIATSQLRKFDGIVPTLDDVKGSSNLAYESKAVYAVINEVKDEYFVDPLTFDYQGKKWPLVYFLCLKNKVSDWEEPIFYGLIKNRCQLIPVNSQIWKDAKTKLSIKKREVLQSAKQ